MGYLYGIRKGFSVENFPHPLPFPLAENPSELITRSLDACTSRWGIGSVSGL